MSAKRHPLVEFPHSSWFIACLVLFCFANTVSACEDDICIDLEHLSGRLQFSIPPNEINYVLELPEEPRLGVKVYVYLMRAKANGQFEIASQGDSQTMSRSQRHARWDPRRTPPIRKMSDTFVLAATLDPHDRNPRAITREFSIKWR
jgi:hypothetical protein